MKTYTENELRTKLLSNEQIKMFFNFIDSSFGNSELKDELKYLISDYNKVISSYLNMVQIFNSSHRTVFTKSNENTLLKSSPNSISNTIENEYKKTDEDLGYQTNYYYNDINGVDNITEPHMIIMKRTNEILKMIDLTLGNQNYYGTKYSKDGNYKSFLDSLINYKYSLKELNEIKNDIQRTKKYTPFIPTSPKRICKEESVFEFDKSLRRYPDDKNDINDLTYLTKKPFYRFTKTHGDYFDKNLKRISSPLRHKPTFE